ncbi:Stromelysin-3 [Dissostichus eleginoides]|uniref:Stromelysin-3 n=1 Tax=Dissostichus eleginoides TaxID=100907 RepID=A0AAD9BI65_DISEL|nr:Stromelysin-3 [Dissostichus eleginoides]
MHTLLFCGSIFTLHLFLCAKSVPVQERSSRSKPLQVKPHSNGNVVLKKRGRHQQETLNKDHHLKTVLASKNDTEFWKRPRCGVPDYPSLTQVGPSYYDRKKKGGLKREQRRKRYALFGGRWEKTDLTYKIEHFPWQMSEGRVRQVLQEAFSVWSAVTPLTLREVTSGEADIVIDFNRYWHGDSLPFDGPGGILAHAYFPRTHREAMDSGQQCGQPDMTETNEIDLGVMDACRTNFDAVSMIRGELFFFRSAYVWRIRDGQLQAGYPALASRHWRGIPDHIDAAYEDKSGNIWFFQGESYWVFDAERKITGPDSVRQLGLPVSDIQAALKWEEDHVEKVYFFKSASYWPFNPQENRVDDVRPGSMQAWGGIPGNIDAAFRDKYGYANFLSGQHYWKFDPVALKVLDGFPRSIGTDFFGCSAFLYK